MRKMFDEEEDEYSDLDKKKIIVTIIPFVLIIIILAVMLFAGGMKKNKDDTDALQQSIMDYADEHGEADSAGRKEEQSQPKPAEETTDLTDRTDAKDTGEEIMPSPSPYKDVMEQDKVDLSKVTYNTQSQLKEMMAYWADNNQKALDDLANLERFMAMSWSLRGTNDCYYYGDKDANGLPNGRGIAVYRDNQYYYGDWKNGLRSGNGTWIHYHIHADKNKTDFYTYHQYTGGWRDDLPSGEGSEHYEYDTTLLKEGIGYDTNLVGSYLGGMIHGDFFITNLYSDGTIKEWNAKAENGAWIYQSETKDKKGNRTVYVDIHDPENYIWMKPADNVNIKVPCLITNAIIRSVSS